MSTNISYYNFKSIFTTTKSSQIRFFNSLESIAKISTTFKTLKIVFKNYNLLSTWQKGHSKFTNLSSSIEIKIVL